MHTDNLIHCILSLQIFMRMDLPKIITTDNGTEFKNELNNHLMELLGIDHRLTTAYLSAFPPNPTPLPTWPSQVLQTSCCQSDLPKSPNSQMQLKVAIT